MTEGTPATPWRWTTILATALVAVLLLGAGVAIGALITHEKPPSSHSADAGFARDMSEHHAQAVEMGMIAVRGATLSDVRYIASDIALTQQAQIGSMQQWLRDWHLLPTGDQPPMAWMPDGQRALEGNRMPGMATKDELAKLRAATGKDLDIQFCNLMLRHHLGGIHMVDGILAQSDDEQVIELATSMRKSQLSEVQALESLLKALNATPAK